MNMKLKYTIGCLFASAALVSCSDYLNESSGDLLILKKWMNSNLFSTEKVIQTISQPMWNG